MKMFEDRIIIDPEIRHGKPVIKGTRVPIDIILGSRRCRHASFKRWDYQAFWF
jgi:uncharacterized protein (DUF433 family)